MASLGYRKGPFSAPGTIAGRISGDVIGRGARIVVLRLHTPQRGAPCCPFGNYPKLAPYDALGVDMKSTAKDWMLAWISALGLACCVGFLPIRSARAQETASHVLSNRAQIQDLITRYYYNFGKANPESFPQFYAKGAELILGTARFKGRAEIAKAYEQAGKHGPSRKAYAFNVTISNPLIVVHGKTATAELIFTEFVTQKKGEAPRIRTQGREYSTFVKVNGQWRYKTRQIKAGTKPPKNWKP